jgi:triosephosphate isomerase
MIFLSLKTYKEATGEAAIQLLSSVKKISQETGVPIIPCAQPSDIYRIKKELDIEVWAQHIDPIDPGRNFGWISPYALALSGASGTVINHDEHSISEELIKKTIDKAKEYSLKTLVLCDSVALCQKVAAWNPEFVGYERGDLIAGQVAMIDVEAENIKTVAGTIKQPLIVGASISTPEHIKKTLAAGGHGVILASSVVKSKNPAQTLSELAMAFRS